MYEISVRKVNISSKLLNTVLEVQAQHWKGLRLHLQFVKGEKKKNQQLQKESEQLNLLKPLMTQTHRFIMPPIKEDQTFPLALSPSKQPCQETRHLNRY